MIQRKMMEWQLRTRTPEKLVKRNSQLRRQIQLHQSLKKIKVKKLRHHLHKLEDPRAKNLAHQRTHHRRQALTCLMLFQAASWALSHSKGREENIHKEKIFYKKTK